MIRILYRHRSGTLISTLTQDQIQTAVKDKQARIWIDMIQPTAEEYNLVLRQSYQFHPLAIEDTTKDTHVPKIDDYNNYLYLVFHTISMGDERMDIQTNELDVFLGANYLITIHDEPRPIIDAMWDEAYHKEKGLARGPAFLLYELLDKQIDSYIPLLERFENRLEEMGDLIFDKAYRNKDLLLNHILTAKSSALRIHRILTPQRTLMDQLSWNDYAVIPAEARIYYHDVFDHLVRLDDLAESMRELASSTMETYLALTNIRMNEIMKVLTVISTIFIPLGFLSSVYGMNFDFMPELHLSWGYPFLWVVFITIVGLMLWAFRRRGWL